MAKKKASGGAYGFGHIINIILAIIPITSIILGIVTRAQRGKILGAVLNFFLFPLFSSSCLLALHVLMSEMSLFLCQGHE